MTARRGFVVALVVVGALAPAALAAATWPRWWTWIAPEQTPMTWLQSVVLVLAAATSLLLWLVERPNGRPRRAWLVLAGGFTALAFDERFAVHERVRDGVLAPRGVEVPFLPWVAPGDFLLMIVALVGLAVLPAVWRAVRPDRAAARSLVVGVVLALVAVGLDSVDPATWSIAAERLEQSGEEVIELASGLALLGAVVLRLLGVLAALGALDSPQRRHDGAELDNTGPIKEEPPVDEPPKEVGVGG